jgi:spermidine synthase
VSPDEVVGPAVHAEWAVRLAAYWAARNQFIVAGRAVRPATDVQDMLSQVRGPLLAVLRTSPDFRPAYDPLLRMASALSADSDVPGARALLTELDKVQPRRAEAAQALRQLAGATP